MFASFAVVATFACLPLSARAQSIQVSPEQVRGQFAQQGFVAGTPTTWAMDNVTTFTVADPREATSIARVLMVLVYGDDTAASNAREHSRTSNQPLVPGYGEAAWKGNVALVQSSMYELGQYYQAQQDRDNGLIVQIGQSAGATDVAIPGRVDVDFLLALSPLTSAF
jgi:hypothetical protein